MVRQSALYAAHSEQVLRLAGLGPGMRVLDVGCGPGDVSLLAARLVAPGGSVLGIDASAVAVDLARSRAAAAGVSTASFARAVLPEVDLDGPVDAVVGRLILMHLDDPVGVLRRLAAVVRPGGVVVFQEFVVRAMRTIPRLGRAYVGNYGFDVMSGGQVVPTDLFGVDPDGTVSVAAGDLVFPNGVAITPDERTLIVGETFGSRYTAFDIRPDGALTGRRVWAQPAPALPLAPVAEMLAVLTFAPDGCALDAAGNVWSANPAGSNCMLLAPGGQVLDDVLAPLGQSIFACALGGADGRTLLVCVAPDFLESNRSAAREAVLMTTTVDTPGAGLG